VGVLARVLDDAARGVYPAPDGSVDVVPAPDRLYAAVFSFTAHLVVAAGVPDAEVREVAPAGDFRAWGAVAPWLAARAGAGAPGGDALLSAIADGRETAVDLEPVDMLEHPRVARAARYRDDLRVHVTRDGHGVLVLGRGVAGRHEIAFEVDPAARGRGLGRALVESSLALVPAGEVVWAQVHPGNAASLRAVLAAGFAPVAFEQLVSTH
jgi:GNAT superfamily N-acetyltransferase